MRLINSAFKNLFVLSAACGLLLGEVRAATQASAFADSYSPVPGVSMAQSQVVYYRQGNAGQSDTPAFVYIDKEFHTGLLPGGYTVFCLTPGRHGLSAVLDEAPEYGGKRLQPGVRLAAGRTHFIRVDEAGGLEPQLVDRDVAERELASATARRQAHVVSRADAVRSCEYVEKPEVRSYSLSSDVLFGFGKSAYEDIRAEGRAEFNQLERRLSAGSLKVERIAVIGHTDPIGSEAYNDALGLRRAQTVRQMLIDGGMNPERVRAFSEGSRELLSEGCQGSREQVIACHAKDRRVTIEVEASDNT
ncbi:MAG: OmpA family protein [Stenotrophomonas sp.]